MHLLQATRMVFRFGYFVLTLLCVSALAFAAEKGRQPITTVTVITTDQFPVDINPLSDGVVVDIFNVDATRKSEKALSEGLPTNEAGARQAIEVILQGEGRDRFQQRLLTAYEPLFQAMKWSIDRMPAMIFDGRAVVYGVTDIAEAQSYYHAWLDTLEADHE